jgi:hypothetical protein
MVDAYCFARPESEGSDSVVEKEVLRSTREVSKVMLTVLGCVILIVFVIES